MKEYIYNLGYKNVAIIKEIREELQLLRTF